jgi:long-chain fatty acid transport protein
MSPQSGSLVRTAVQAVVLAAITSGFSPQTFASGFAVTEKSASAQGNSYAGFAASAEDATTVWSNPAGMMKLDGNQFVAVGHYIYPGSTFVNQGSTNADGTALSGANDNDAFAGAFIPNFYWVTAINEEMKFGLGINTPYGLVTDYDDTWVGRYHAVTSDLKTVNLNPSIAFQDTEKLSVGVGLNILLVDVELTSAIDFGALLNSPGTADGFADLEGDNLNGIDDLAYGLNIGLMYDITSNTTLGLAYRSEMDIDVKGTANFKVPTAAAPVLASGAFVDSGLYASITLPQIFSVSVAHDYGELKVLADITWTGWSSFEELRIKYDNPDQPDSVTTEEWEDVFRYSIGVDWQYSNKVILRSGIAYDETPIPSAERTTARIPGNDVTWLSFGGTYIINPEFTVDIGYTHIFVSDTRINNTFESSQPALAATLRGTYEDVSADILSAQLRWNY